MPAKPGTLALFFGYDDTDPKSLEALHATEAMQQVRSSMSDVPNLLRDFATASVAKALGSVMKTNLIDVLMAAWKTRDDLLDFCDPAKHPPGEVGNYVLAHHTISSDHTPRFQVMLDGAKCGPEIDFDIHLELAIDAACLLIKDGRILEVETGAIDGSGSVSCGAKVLLERESGKFEIPGKLSFGDGIGISDVLAGGPARHAA